MKNEARNKKAVISASKRSALSQSLRKKPPLKISRVEVNPEVGQWFRKVQSSSHKPLDAVKSKQEKADRKSSAEATIFKHVPDHRTLTETLKGRKHRPKNSDANVEQMPAADLQITGKHSKPSLSLLRIEQTSYEHRAKRLRAKFVLRA